MVSMVILLSLFVFLFGFVVLDGKYSVHGSDYTEYTIVGLFPLSGDMSTFAENSVVSANLAVSDINNWLADEGKDWRLNLEVVDTELNAEVALSLMQQWHEEKGVDFFVGPMASGEAGACLDYANDNEILFISPSATSESLKVDDWFFRFVVDDTFTHRVQAALIDEYGVKELILTWPDRYWEDYNKELLTNAVADFNPNINIYDSEQYRYDPDESDFADTVEGLNKLIADLVSQGVDYEDIGLVCIGADHEVAAIMTEADNYTQMKKIMWFGTEYSELSDGVLTYPVAAQFAADVGFIYPRIRMDVDMPEESWYEYIKEHIQAEVGREPDYYAYATNDIICVLALSFDEHGYDSVTVKENLPDKTDEYTKVYGSSGHVVLNEYGDRAYADFALWEVNNQKEWQDVGYYEGVSGDIFWYDLPTFTDVPTDHPFFTEIGALAESGITTGYDDGSFRPTANVTRMAMAAFLYRGLELEDADVEEPTFSDVPEDHPFFIEIEALAASGITTGYDDGTFRPSANVTRQAMAAFLVRGLDLEEDYDVPAEPTFSDVSSDHPFFTEIELLAASGITTGYDDNTFRPSANVTRMAMAAFLFRGLELE